MINKLLSQLKWRFFSVRSNPYQLNPLVPIWSIMAPRKQDGDGPVANLEASKPNRSGG